MKQIFILLFFCVSFKIYAQQILSNNSYGPRNTTLKAKEIIALDGSKRDIIVKDTINFKVFGVGNISDETLKKINAGGKAVFAFYPDPFDTSWQSNYFVSYNKNATNTDSALASTLIFPEAGSHSFLMHAFWKSTTASRPNKYRGLFVEFAVKKITNKKDTTDPKLQEFSFNTLHYTAGYKWGFSKEKFKDNKMQTMGCEFSLFGAFVNIPDEDHENFEKIINKTSTKNSFCMVGFKMSFELNGFQIFSDIRHVFGDKEKLPVNDLKGFNYNIGVSFNTEVLNF